MGEQGRILPPDVVDYQVMLEALVPVDSNQPRRVMLEVGCGRAETQSVLTEHFLPTAGTLCYVGADLNHEFILDALEFNAMNLTSEEVHTTFIEADARKPESLPLPGPIDVLVARHPQPVKDANDSWRGVINALVPLMNEGAIFIATMFPHQDEAELEYEAIKRYAEQTGLNTLYTGINPYAEHGKTDRYVHIAQK